ncbi:carbonic anhydrase 2 [Chironomus tepperi]|uniref:carbonic anhydrase 2 n=1 Tax=Chironomus tepperi TaxID=113505 RepID=UPI00391F00C4
MRIVEVVILIVVLFSTMLMVISSRFGYSVSEQRMWKRKHKNCNGRHQSPVSIHSRRAIPSAMPALEFIYYHNPLPGPLTIRNNGHSVSLQTPKTENSTRHHYHPYIFGGKLRNEYEYVSLHFHWGDKNSRGAEHVLNDIRYPLELHMIHINRKYQTIEEALEHRDGLAVLAFFFQIRENLSYGEEIDNIVKHFSDLNELTDSVTLPYSFSLQSLIGNINTDRFYTYRGSLTTPTCNEAVTWIIFPDTIPISLSQMSKFRSLSNGIEGLLLVDNYRHLQPVGNRKIFLRSISTRTVELEKIVEMEMYGRALVNRSDSNVTVDDSEWYYN